MSPSTSSWSGGCLRSCSWIIRRAGPSILCWSQNTLLYRAIPSSVNQLRTSLMVQLRTEQTSPPPPTTILTDWLVSAGLVGNISLIFFWQIQQSKNLDRNSSQLPCYSTSIVFTRLRLYVTKYFVDCTLHISTFHIITVTIHISTYYIWFYWHRNIKYWQINFRHPPYHLRNCQQGLPVHSAWKILQLHHHLGLGYKSHWEGKPDPRVTAMSYSEMRELFIVNIILTSCSWYVVVVCTGSDINSRVTKSATSNLGKRLHKPHPWFSPYTGPKISTCPSCWGLPYKRKIFLNLSQGSPVPREANSPISSFAGDFLVGCEGLLLKRLLKSEKEGDSWR